MTVTTATTNGATAPHPARHPTRQPQRREHPRRPPGTGQQPRTTTTRQATHPAPQPLPTACLADPDRRQTRHAVRLRRDSPEGWERPRLRRRGRAPAPGRGPAVVAAARPDPAALGGAPQGRFAVLRTGLRPPLTRPPRRGPVTSAAPGGQKHAARPRPAIRPESPGAAATPARGAACWPAVVERVDVHAGRHDHARAEPAAGGHVRGGLDATHTPLTARSPHSHARSPPDSPPDSPPTSPRLLRPGAPLTQPLSAALTGPMRPGSPPL
jgi:hypothetical protein